MPFIGAKRNTIFSKKCSDQQDIEHYKKSDFFQKFLSPKWGMRNFFKNF